MEVLYACCCGIDVHAKMLVACVIKDGQKETRRDYSPMKRQYETLFLLCGATVKWKGRSIA